MRQILIEMLEMKMIGAFVLTAALTSVGLADRVLSAEGNGLASRERGSAWQAKWIGAPDCLVQDWRALERPAPVFRRRFALEAEVPSARLRICGLGFFHARLDGRDVSDAELCPTPTKYDSLWRYRTFSLGSLAAGEHEFVVEVGNGLYFPVTPDSWHFDKASWLDYPKLIAEIADGTGRVLVGTDRSWQVRYGSTVHTAFRGGETYDARRETDDEWMIPRIVAGPGGVGEEESFPPCRVLAALPMRRLDGTDIYDSGENLAGVPRITVRGASGAKVSLICGESLTDDGKDVDRGLDYLVLHSPDFQRDEYVLKGGATETWRPRFTYHGFRYVKVLIEGEATLLGLEALKIGTDFVRIGSMRTSDRTLTEIACKAMRAIRANYVGNPTDCPTREKNGWLSEARLQNEALLYEFDASGANLAFVDSALACQRPGGQLPGIVPTAGWGYTWGSGPAWESGVFLIAEQAFRFSGTHDWLAERYDCLVRNVEHHAAMCDERGVLPPIGLGDWLAPELERKRPQRSRRAESSWAYPESTNTSPAYVQTAFYKRLLDLAAEVALRKGLVEESRRFRCRAVQTARAMRTTFGRPKSTTACALSLEFGICEDGERRSVAETLVGIVRANRHRVDYGTIGSGCVLRQLFENGYADDAYRMMVQPDYPGYGYLANLSDLTAFPEEWSVVGVGQSRNHGAFADVVACMYRYLAGIRHVSRQPGRSHVEICPCFPKGLADFSATHEGFSVSWRRTGKTVDVEVVVPRGKNASYRFADGRCRDLAEGSWSLSSGSAEKEENE